MSQPNLLELEAPIKICGEQAGRRARATLQASTFCRCVHWAVLSRRMRGV